VIGIGVLGLNAASRADEVLCSDNNEYVDDVFDSCVDSLPEVNRYVLCCLLYVIRNILLWLFRINENQYILNV
jgi:hypothetical protein